MDSPPVDAAARQSKLSQEAEPSNPQCLSKKAQKRAAKAARLHELKLERRTREREAKRHKRRERALAVARGELEDNNSQTRQRKDVGGEAKTFNARVVVDLGFDDLMSDKEISSLTSQLAYTYSANRHAAHAFPVLLFTSLNGRTKQRLDAMNNASYTRWSGTEWWEEGYDHLWSDPSRFPPSHSDETRAQCTLGLPARANRKNIVYLTADSPEELLALNEGETYIIGGICDHNRYKNLCLNKAIGSQIRHARLPIGRYVSLATRKVLTVNQVRFHFIDPTIHITRSLRILEPNVDAIQPSVFEILLKWLDTRDWENAFWAVIPRRKLQCRMRKSGITEQDDDNGRCDRDAGSGGELMETLKEAICTDLCIAVEDEASPSA